MIVDPLNDLELSFFRCLQGCASVDMGWLLAFFAYMSRIDQELELKLNQWPGPTKIMSRFGRLN